MLSKVELRKLIRAHNKLSKITIPKGATAEDMVKLIEAKNYVVDHEAKVIRPKQQRGKQIKLKDTDELLKAKPKTALQKQKMAEKKKEKEMAQKKKERAGKKEAVAKSKKGQMKDSATKKKEKEKKKIRDKLKKEPGRPRVNPNDIEVINPYV